MYFCKEVIKLRKWNNESPIPKYSSEILVLISFDFTNQQN